MEEKSKSFDYISALKGFAAVMIVLGHMQYGGIWPDPKLLGISIQWLTFADISMYVWVFFLLSGYLIGKGFFTERYTLNIAGVWDYFLKRLKRIVPSYYFILIVIIFLFKVWTWHYFEHLAFFTFTFLGSHLITTLSLDYLWAISVEMQWYVTAPLFYLFFRFVSQKNPVFHKALLIVILLLGVTLRTYAFSLYTVNSWGVYLEKIISPFLFNLDFFLFGMGLNLLLFQKKDDKVYVLRSIRFLSLGLVLLFFLITSFFNHKAMMGSFSSLIRLKGILGPLLTMSMFGLYIYLVERHSYNSSYSKLAVKISANFLRSPLSIFAFLGTLSLEMYLVHIPIMRISNWFCTYQQFGCNPQQFFQRFFLLLGTSIFCAWVLQKSMFKLTNKMKYIFKKILMRG